MCSFGRCRTSLLVSGSVRRCGARRSKSSSGSRDSSRLRGRYAAGLGLHGASGAPRRLSRNAFDYSTSGRLCHGLARASPWRVRHRRSDRCWARPSGDVDVYNAPIAKAELWPSRKSHVPKHRSPSIRTAAPPSLGRRIRSRSSTLPMTSRRKWRPRSNWPRPCPSTPTRRSSTTQRPRSGRSRACPSNLPTRLWGRAPSRKRTGPTKWAAADPSSARTRRTAPLIACEWIRANGR